MFNLVGLLVSFLSTIFIYPLSLETYGVLQFVMSTSNLILPLISLSASSVIVYFHIYYKDRINELITVQSVLIAIITLISIGLFLAASQYLPQEEVENVFNFYLFNNYGIWIILISGCLAFTSINTAVLNLYNRIVFPQFFTNLFLKVLIAILIVLTFAKYLTLRQSVVILFIYHLISIIALWIYQGRFHKYKITGLSDLTKKNWKGITSYSAYNILSGLGTTFAFRIDIILISLMLGVKEAGIYSLFLFMANMIELPSNGYIRIISPQISNDIKNNKLEPVRKIYQNSSKILMILGGFIGLSIVAALPSLLNLMKNGTELKTYFAVWLILALSKWINMFTSVNSQIIAYSHYYRYNFLLLLILSIINVVLNYFLIMSYGIVGAAIATATSITLYNLGKYILIKRWFKMIPFSTEAYKGLVLLLFTALLLYLIPNFDSDIVNIIFRAIITITTFLTGVFYWDVSDEIKSFIVNNAKVFTNGRI